jgi:hypothetical protein
MVMRMFRTAKRNAKSVAEAEIAHYCTARAHALGIVHPFCCGAMKAFHKKARWHFRDDLSGSLLAMVCTLALLVRAQAQQTQDAAKYVEVEGSVRLLVYGGKADQELRDTNAFTFRCITGLERWSFTSTFMQNAIELFYYDGTNTYARWQFTAVATNAEGRSPMRVHQAQSLDELNNPSLLVIKPGPHPLGNAGANIVWLAFCSGQYLKAQARLIPLPICEIQHTPQAFAYTDETKAYDDELGLPQSVLLRESRELLERRTQEERIFTTQRPLPVSWETGRIAFTYKVQQETNYTGWIIPVEFRLEQYSYSPEGNVQWRTVAMGAVSSIRTAAGPARSFARGDTYRIVDMRFRSKDKVVESVTYAWSNAIPPAVGEPLLQALFKEKQGKMPLRPRPQQERHRVAGVRYLLATVLALPVLTAAYFLVRRKNSEGNRTEKKKL